MEDFVESDALSSELETVKLVNGLFNKSKRARSEKVSEFSKLWDFAVKGKQWPKKRPSYRHSEVLNFTFSIIQSIIPIMTDVRPKVEVLPREPEDRIFAEVLSKVIEDTWGRLYFDQQVVEAIFDAMIFGTSISMIGWDKDANFGIGEVTWKVVDPLMCYPDPLATDINSPESKFFGYIEEVDLGDLKRKYPDKADRLTYQTIEKKKEKNIDVEDVDKIDPEREGVTEAQNALLYRLWMKSEETENYTLENGEEGSKKKYPNGRYIEMCNNTILVDVGDKGDYPFKDGMFPFARLVDHMVAREFWGIGEVEFLKSAQMSLNKSISWILDSLDSTGKPIWVVDVQSGVDTDNLTNTPGLVVEKNAGTEVRREPGLPVPPSIFNVFNLLKGSFDQINGLGELSQGQKPAGVTSGAAIESLQEAAQTRIRQKARNLETFLRQVGHLMVSRIMQFYKVPRMFRVVNPVDGFPEYFEFYIGDEGVKLQNIKEVEGQMVPSGMVNVPLSKETNRKGFMDVTVSVGSALPFNKQMKTRQSFELFDRQIIPAKEVLKNIDYPNWEAIAAEQEEKLAMQAEAAAQAEAQKGMQ